MNNAIENTLKNLGMELTAKNEHKGVIFEIYRLKNCCLECYTYPIGEEHKKKFFASSSNLSITWICFYIVNAIIVINLFTLSPIQSATVHDRWRVYRIAEQL